MIISKQMGILGEVGEGIMYLMGIMFTRYLYLSTISDGFTKVLTDGQPLMIVAQVFTIIVAIGRLYIMWPKLKEKIKKLFRKK